MSEKTIRLGLLGFGTVGRGVYRVLTANRDLIYRRTGTELKVTRIAVRDLDKERGVDVSRDIFTTDAAGVAAAADVDVVVELIGGTDAARDLVLGAIGAGKHVVTANKALLAEHGSEIRRAAAEAGVELGFEASVAGGIPVIKTIAESLAANRILSIFGIINGTSNYILTKMRDEGREFSSVLAEAQKAGYAEADPTFDVNGMDSAHKLAILVNLAFGVSVDLADIYTEGISQITPLDIQFGREFGYTLKLLAIAKASSGSIEARVHPTLIPDDHPIAQVGGVYNAIQVIGDAVGDLMLQGRGAGEFPTASAVMGDVADICRRLQAGATPGGVWTPEIQAQIQSIEDTSSPYYLRFMVEDKPGVLSQISGLLGRHDISIESVIQKGRDAGQVVALVVMTHVARERDIRKAVEEINGLDCVAEKGMLIRVEGEDSLARPIHPSCPIRSIYYLQPAQSSPSSR